MKQAYVTALTEALMTNSDTEMVLNNVQRVLIKKGHGRLWPAVLRGALRGIKRMNRANVPHVTVATKADEKITKIQAALVAVGSSASDTYEVSVDSTLIGGLVVRYRDKMYDASYKRALVDLYRKVTK